MRTAAGIILREVVVGDAAGDDADRFVGGVRIAVEPALCGFGLEPGVVVEQRVVPYARIARHQHPLARLGGVGAFVLGADAGDFDHGPRMGHAGCQTHQYGNTVLLREVEGRLHHVVGLLLVRRFEYRYKGKFTIYPGILLILRGMHRRIVGCGNYQSTVSSGNSCIHEAIGCHIHTDVFHTYQGSFAGVRHA